MPRLKAVKVGFDFDNMIKKELSITELFGVLSVIALTISVFSNAYFYYYLDAMWVMSILSPTFYISEILKVLMLMSLAIIVVGFLMDAFKWLVKKSFIFRKKQRFVLSVQQNTNNIVYQRILKKDKSFQFWQTIFVIVISTITIFLLTFLGFISITSMLWNSVLIGFVVGLFTNKEIRKDKELKLFILIGVVVFTTCFSAELKLNNIHQLPIAKLKNDKGVKNTLDWYVLDGSQDKLILLNQSSKKVIKVVKFEEIDRIISNKK